jgi:hypothetical protein
MAKCANCNKWIIAGGKRDGDLRFCDAKCQEQGALTAVASVVPDQVVNEQAWKIHQGACPKCGGRGPIDVHTSYRVWSALVMTNWSSRPHVVCRSCGTKARMSDAARSLAFGWWGFPWGLIMTPVQVCRNLKGDAQDPAVPSLQLQKLVRLNLASQALAAGRSDLTPKPLQHT